MVELLIVMGVFVMLTGVVLANYRTFDTNAKFANASEDVVLALRQAQVYGVGVKGNTGMCGGGTTFDCAYGVYFSTAPLNRNGVSLFVDANNNKKYDTGGTEDIPGGKISWGTAIEVSLLSCTPICTTVNELSVTFKRPSPDAFINDGNAITTQGATSPYQSVAVTIRDVNTTKTSAVTVTTAGQISL